MFRYQVLIEYIGTSFVGWQIQSKGKSIQKEIQIKLSKLLKEKGYPIARRTIAKYREQLELSVARLRKEL
jgi:tRNA U38,U39,U40 pseudouridine synthase TruA